jgi:hypothetical protein
LDLEAPLAEKLDEHSMESRVCIQDTPGTATPVCPPAVKQLYRVGVQNKVSIQVNVRGLYSGTK